MDDGGRRMQNPRPRERSAVTPNAGCRFVTLLLLAAAFTASPAFGKKSVPAVAGKPAAPRVVALKLQPAALALENGRDTRRVLVFGRTAAGQWIDLSAEARLQPVSGGVRVERDGTLVPVRKGVTRVTVLVGGQQTDLPVTVRSVANPPVSFVRDVMPVLSRTGCNAGTCHGSAKGKNGFKLSLRGYDPEFDYRALVDDLSGRRFNRSDPDRSLMLLKPSQGVPHVGGMVLEPGSPYFRIVRQWIVEGVRSDVETTKRVSRLEVLPGAPQINLPGDRQQLLVLAHYPDGSTRDVSRDVVYTSSVPEVATVTPDGLVTAVRRGESAVLVRYEGSYATNPLIVLGDRTGYRWVETPAYNFIDTLVYRKLKRIKALPGPLCSDADFLRRISLDLVGLPPTPEQVRAFLADPTPTKRKRERMIDRLLGDGRLPASLDFVDHWTNKWGDLLQCNRKYLGEKGAWAFRNWIQESVAANKPYDQFARELITASGNPYESPAANYFRVAREPNVAAENVTQLFLGVRFACAKCHDHPFERWTQNQYYQLGAFFARVGTKNPGMTGDETVYDRPDGEVTHPKTARTVAPAFPVSYAATPPPHPSPKRRGELELSRREALARWLTAPENPFFARAMANRMWSYFLGRGIIDPVDDVRTSNPPSNPELLQALTEEFVKSRFDLKHLMRTITRSRTYQQSLATNRWNEDDRINFSHAVPRRLTAEQLIDTLSRATGTTPTFAGMPPGLRAAQLPDSKVGAGGFLDLFGRPARESPCECERASAVSLSQALNLINGATVNDSVADPNGRIARLMKTKPDDRKIVEELYLAALCRPPSAGEVKKATAYLTSATSRTEGAQDLMWALINSPAFLFNR
jgi:hypothetical protein